MKFNITCEGSVIGWALVILFYPIVLAFYPLMWIEWKIKNFFS